ncbi:MAG: hypothetical protein GY747_02165 [Planctomycetes bacterium]|nr:hypothetical protein [Planctomycetota bacterium]MCP4770034.1 hypothetical protein [Planctomycetota bacterium]MCP4859874.1 hypothetical protein [Planctomycetota bacterium]
MELVRLILIGLLLWCLVGGGELHAQELETASEQLSVASKIYESSKGRKGPRRLQILHEAIEAYERVNQLWPSTHAECALAAFRRGEIHRALDEVGEARGAFEEVLEVTKSNPDLHVRALLELGHMDRREERWRDCVLRYQQAVKHSGASLRFQNDAREWIVKVHLSTMAWTSAVREAERWLEFCEGPLEEVQALDLQLRALIGARELRLAREQLLDLQGRMAVLAEAPTAEGRRIAKALEQMKAPKALKLARQNGR